MDYEIKSTLKRILNKVSKKNKRIYEQILKKIDEVVGSESIEHYKNLRYDLKDFKRVHVGSFALIFKLDKEKNLISFEDFQHHDKIYRRKI